MDVLISPKFNVLKDSHLICIHVRNDDHNSGNGSSCDIQMHSDHSNLKALFCFPYVVAARECMVEGCDFKQRTYFLLAH